MPDLKPLITMYLEPDLDPLVFQLEVCRIRSGMSVHDLAKAARIADSTWLRAMVGGHGLQVHTLRSVARALGMDLVLVPNTSAVPAVLRA